MNQIKLYFKSNFDIFKLSFKNLKKVFIPIYLYDILFFLIFTASLIFLSSISKTLAAQYSALNLYGADNVVMSLIRSLMLSVGLAAIIYYVVFLAVYSALKSFIWQRIAGIKITWHTSYKFFQICIVWISVFVVVFILLLFSIKNEFYTHLFYIAGFLWIHLATIISWHAVKHPRLRKTLTKTFDIGITKFPRFILPYLVSFLVFFVYNQIWRLAPRFIASNTVYATLSYILIILVPFITWFRVYMAKVLEKL